MHSEHLPYQTLMFSASWSAEVQSLALAILRPGAVVRVTVGNGRTENLATNSAIGQRIEVLPMTCARNQMTVNHQAESQADSEKLKRLVGLLENLGHGRDAHGRKRKMGPAERGKALVFTSTKARCEAVCMALQRKRVAADRIHADRNQKLRDAALSAFAIPGSGRVLVATDVAARGIDVKDIQVVVNFDLPLARGDTGMEQYIHRIGRTARGADSVGKAVSYFDPVVDTPNAACLIKLMQDAGQLPPPELLALVETNEIL